MSSAAFALPMAAEGERVTIVAIAGGRPGEKRLIDLGLTVGKELTVLQRQAQGSLVVALGGARLALGFAFAQRVLVMPIGGEAIDERRRD
ncbi:MAG: ferrous iron transport protein A [Alphaproteobacteria bacterium]|nr:ferrous iron transport protein A [Alphaproteobacteria bacterium]